jgi:hypothetical protein
MTSTTQPSELGPYTPVSDALVLAAMDRAQRHNPNGYDYGVLWSRLVEHLGFIHAPATTFKLRPQLSRLRAAGLVEHHKARGYTVWRLTSDGRKQLAKARRKREDLRLPESPQHRLWREARATAAGRIEGIREQLHGTLSEASNLLDADSGDSDAWFDLCRRLLKRCERYGSMTYCVREWPEPDDAHADIEDPSGRHSDSRRAFYREVDDGCP